MKTIVFTGGHHNSALEVAKILKQKGYDILWLGHKHSAHGDNSLSFEYHELKRAEIRFIELKTGKFYQPDNFSEWLKIPAGIYQAWHILKQNKVKLIVSFGGYLSSPVVIAGFLQKIPSVCHEQTVRAGMANRLNAHFAQKVFISWSESFQYFPVAKTIHTGVPLRASVRAGNLEKIIDFNNDLPTLFITGGKQGSHRINQLVSQSYPELLKKYNIIHQTGGLKKTNDYFRLKKIRENLPNKLKKRLWQKKYFFQKEMSQALRQADLVICRAGAHTVYELITLGKPALFIPLSLSMTREQYQNAQKAKSLGIADILLEENAKAKTLVLKIEEVFKDINRLKKMGKKAKQMVKTNATELIVSEIEKLL